MQSRLPANTNIIFISDVHFGAFSDEKNQLLERELISLIDFAERENYQIAVLGDLFDYWIEYPGDVPHFGQNILQRFKEFHDSAPASLYVTGNHDNWTLGHFRDCGFDVEPDYRLLTISDCSILLMHGDATGSAPDHLQRPLLHRFIRSESFLNIYRTVFSPAMGLRVMKNYSKFSRMLGSEQSDPEELNYWSKELLKNNDIDVVICGHDHRPRRKNYNYGTFFNLGTFHQHRTLVSYNKHGFSLVKWSSAENKLISENL